MVSATALLAVVLVAELAVAAPAAELPPPQPRPAPFSVGERIVYDVRWGFVEAGEIAIELAARRHKRGRPAWRFEATATSSRLVSAFYRVEDRLVSLIDADDFLPLQLRLEVDEEKERGLRQVVYRHDDGVARYLRHRTFHAKRGPSRDERVDPLPAGSLDAFSAFLRLRAVELAPGRGFFLPVHEKGSNHRVRVEVGAPEEVTTGLGRQRAWPLEVAVRLEDKLATRDGLRVWVSDDPRRLVLRFEADLAFGSLVGVARDYRPGRNDPRRAVPARRAER